MPILGVLAFELVAREAFLPGGHWAGGCTPTLGWSMLPLVSSSCSLAEVNKVDFFYLREQIKINLSPLFLCILKGVHAPSQLSGAGPGCGSREGRWETGYFPEHKGS